MKRTFFQRWVLRLGASKSIAFITAGSVGMSVLVTFISYLIVGMPMEPAVIIVAVIVPMLVAPLASSTVVGLLFELEKAHVQVRTLAVTDELTGAFNRRYFFEVAEAELERATRHALPISLLLIDGDNFKKINDNYGHLCGDQVLQTLSRVCRATVRQNDVFARYGGEEFIVLLPHTDLHGAQVLAERIRRLILNSPVVYGGQPVVFTVSIGIASSNSPACQVSQLVEQADQALYGAKQAGKNCVMISMVEA